MASASAAVPRTREEVAIFMSQKSHFWMATWHDIELVPTASLFKTRGIQVKAFIFQLEKAPTTGKLHFQCYFEFCFQYTMKRLLNQFPYDKDNESGVYWQRRFGNHIDAYTYCSKAETRQADPITYGIFSESLEAAQLNTTNTRQSQPGNKRPSLLDQAVELIEQGKTAKQIAMECPKVFLHIGRIGQLIHARSTPRDWPMEVFVYYGQPGCGKSYECKKTYPNAYWFRPPAAGKQEWWDNYAGQETVVIDEYYGQLSWDYLLVLLDRYPLSVQTKGGYAEFVSKRIVITSNDPPDEWYATKKKSNDKPCDFQVLRRRITRTFKFVLIGLDENGKTKFEKREIKKWQCPDSQETLNAWYQECAKEGGFIEV